MLGNVLRSVRSSRLWPSQATPAYEDIPILSGGATFLIPSDSAKQKHSDLSHGLFQASVTQSPGAVFLIGVHADDIKNRYPMAETLEPVTSVGRVSMTPNSAMAMLRALCGTKELREHIWELFYLEQAGHELDKPGPLAMIPKWAEQQLQPETIASLVGGMQRNDATVGAAVRALMQQHDFTFSMLDMVQNDAVRHLQTQKPLPRSSRNPLKAWQIHAERVVKELRSTIDNPPLALRYLPAIREAQKKAPSVYCIPDSDLPEIAPLLDALILSGGAGIDHHWYINQSALESCGAEALNALERLGGGLWQMRQQTSTKPQVWWEMHEPPELKGASKSYQHRCVQGGAYLVGALGAVDRIAAAALSPAYAQEESLAKDHRLGALRLNDHACRHFLPNEISATCFHSYAERDQIKQQDRSTSTDESSD